MFVLSFGLLIVGHGNGQGVVDYCQADYCAPEHTNVGCNPPPATGGPACSGKAAQEVNLTLFGKSTFLNYHNLLRSHLASGKLPGFQSAVRMPLLVWDEELARQAGHNARSCVVAHDACSNTQRFRHVGQNLARYSVASSGISMDQVIREIIEAWWIEQNVTTQAQLDRYPREHPEAPIAHFTQIINDRAWKIGCAMQTWIENDTDGVIYTVCNYSFGNFADHPVYQRGPSASGCLTGEDTVYPGLCSSKERVFSTPYAISN